MPITPQDIIEAIIDELAMGELGESVDAFILTSIGPGELRLDYGEWGTFRLTVTAEIE
jgi:hypothetical protein